MIERSFAITLDGTVSLDRWSQVLSAWNSSLHHLAQEIGQHHLLGLRVTGLTYGSAVTEVSAQFDDEQIAEQFTKQHDQFSRKLRDGNIIDFPAPLQRSAKRLLKAAKLDEAQEVILSSDTGDFVVGLTAPQVDLVVPVTKAPHIQDQAVAFGGVVGRLQSLSSRGSLRVIVFDELNDKAVRCFITEEQHDEAGALWDQLVEVRGTVSRDPVSGRPLSVRDVVSITPVVEYSGEIDQMAWTRARGALRAIYPDSTSAELIRMARDE